MCWDERREELVAQFAISCYCSIEHRWWFTPHPAPPLNTRIKVPRFISPRSTRIRDDRRPIVKYTDILNNLSDEEWSQLKLPDPASAVPATNVQLCDLGDSAAQTKCVASNCGDIGVLTDNDMHGVLDDVVDGVDVVSPLPTDGVVPQPTPLCRLAELDITRSFCYPEEITPGVFLPNNYTPSALPHCLGPVMGAAKPPSSSSLHTKDNATTDTSYIDFYFPVQ